MCCHNRGGMVNEHWFEGTFCTAEDFVETQSDIAERHLQPEDADAPLLLHHASMPRLAIAAVGESQCEPGDFCSKKKLNGAGGSDTTFHDEEDPKSGTCSSKHASCAGETLPEVLDAIDRNDYGALAHALIKNPGKVIVNEQRRMIQVVGCGAVAAQMRVDVERLMTVINTLVTDLSTTK